MKCLYFFTAMLCTLIFALCARGAEPIQLTINPDKVLNRIDEKIYGHFLEHIYHSVNGGLWGELIWDRSFEGAAGGGGPRWTVENGCVVQHGLAANTRLTFGDRKWTDYEFTLEAQKTGGEEGFLVLFRVTDPKQFYWANLGGWQNKSHGLERGTKGEDRWRGVGRHVAGSIEQGKWRKIRVRCEGPRIGVWLDGKPVIELADDAKAVLRGCVGVGTWQTQARFRNLKVASLDGKVLFEGLPEVKQAAKKQPAAAPHWESYGPGKVESCGDNALNGDRCRKIVSADGETGLGQSPLCIRKGETYRDSLWARGEAEGLVVRLTDGEKILAEKQLGVPGPQWKEFPFELKSDVEAENGEIQVGVRGKGAVCIDQVSMMPESWSKAGGFRPDLLQAIAELKPPVIRWPGGCFASHYRWKHGIGPQHQRVKFPVAMWDDVDVNSFGIDEFINMCRRVKAEPLVVVNIGMHDKRERRGEYCQEACDWVQYCNGPADSKWGKVRAANGHLEPYGVKYWEIDNEVWGLKPEDYASVVRQFVPAMKKIDPSIIVLACGSGQLGGHWAAGDVAVIDKCADVIDYLSVHHYESPAKYADGPAAAEKFWRNRGELIAKSANPKVKLYVSEWNAQSTDWRTGLYAGGALNVFERCGDIVGLAGPALFLRHTSASGWDNAFVNFDHRTWFPAPNYVVMKLWREHYALQRVELSGDPGPLDAVATKSDDGATVYVKVVNPSDGPLPLELKITDGFAVAGASVQIVAPDSLEARNTLDNPHAVKPVAGKVDVAGQSVRLVLPRWSAGAVTIKNTCINGNSRRQ